MFERLPGMGDASGSDVFDSECSAFPLFTEPMLQYGGH